MDCVVVPFFFFRSLYVVLHEKKKNNQTTGEINNGLRVPTTERHVEVPERTDSVKVRAASSLLHCYCCSGGEVVHSSVGARMCLCVCLHGAQRDCEFSTAPQQITSAIKAKHLRLPVICCHDPDSSHSRCFYFLSLKWKATILFYFITQLYKKTNKRTHLRGLFGCKLH